MSDPFFSVIIPLYNTQRYIKETIESVVCQTYQNWELIIIDDGSTDTSLSLAVEASTRDSRIIVLQHEAGKNKGVSATRNLGIERARGKWLAFLDADDLWHKNKLERQFEAICHFGQDLVFIYSRALLMDNKGEMIDGNSPFKYNRKNKFHGAGKAGFLRRPFNQIISKGFEAPTSSVTVKKDIVIRNNILFNENLNFSEDGLFWYEVINYGDIFFIEEALLKYRIHPVQWNAKTSSGTKATRRFLAYSEMLKPSFENHKSRISYLYINKGFRLVTRHFLNPRSFSLNEIYNYLVIVWNKDISFYFKFLSLVVILSEIAFVPLRWIRNQL